MSGIMISDSDGLAEKGHDKRLIKVEAIAIVDVLRRVDIQRTKTGSARSLTRNSLSSRMGIS